MWWLYFDQPTQDIHASLGTTFVWGYVHLVIFAAAAAVGAGVAVAVDQATDRAAIGALGAGAAVAVPVALYLTGLWVIHQRSQAQQGKTAVLLPVVALLVLLSPVSGQAVLVTGLLLAALLTVKLVWRSR